MKSFVVPGQPQGKGRPRVTTRGGIAHAYTPGRTVSYEKLVAAAYREAYPGALPAAGAVQIAIRAVYAIPKSWPRKRKQQALAEMIPVTVKPDCDNVLKVISDALNGVAWQDDKQIVFAQVVKKYGIEPRVEVEIWES